MDDIISRHNEPGLIGDIDTVTAATASYYRLTLVTTDSDLHGYQISLSCMPLVNLSEDNGCHVHKLQ